jgi:hypothetical protein
MVKKETKKEENEVKVVKSRRKGLPYGPVLKVKEKFGSKENLVKELKKIFDGTDIFIDKINKEKGLERVSNAKLLRLYEMAQEVKEKFGSRKALIEKYLEIAGVKNKDQLKEKLSGFTIGRLLDIYRRAIRNAEKTSG